MKQQPPPDVEPMSTTPPPTRPNVAAAAPPQPTATVAVGSSLLRPQSNTAAVGIDGELATVVNIDVFDDQLSLSSISTNSRLSLEGPPSQSSPPLSLSNGLLDTNLMHFSESAAAVSVPADNEDDDNDDDDDEEEGHHHGKRHLDGSDIMPRL